MKVLFILVGVLAVSWSSFGCVKMWLAKTSCSGDDDTRFTINMDGACHAMPVGSYYKVDGEGMLDYYKWDSSNNSLVACQDSACSFPLETIELDGACLAGENIFDVSTKLISGACDPELNADYFTCSFYSDSVCSTATFSGMSVWALESQRQSGECDVDTEGDSSDKGICNGSYIDYASYSGTSCSGGATMQGKLATTCEQVTGSDMSGQDDLYVKCDQSV
eukprot:UN26127